MSDVTEHASLILENGAEVALLGIATTPNTAAAVRDRVEGCEVTLDFDRQRKDGSGRFLAYVFLDQECLNEVVLALGTARVLRDFPYNQYRKNRFLEVERQARQARLGIWAAP